MRVGSIQCSLQPRRKCCTERIIGDHDGHSVVEVQAVELSEDMLQPIQRMLRVDIVLVFVGLDVKEDGVQRWAGRVVETLHLLLRGAKRASQ